MTGRPDPASGGLRAYEVRLLAALGLAVMGAYGGFMALFGVLITVDCSLGRCDAVWMAPLMAVATGVALASIHRAWRPLWTAARTGQRHDAPFRRLGAAWLAALVWGLLSMYPAGAQVLFTGLALPALCAALASVRVAMRVRGRARS